MPNLERLQTYKVICQGGLNSNQNYLDLSDNLPGSATTLLNFEPSLYGGYRRINGYEPLESTANEVDSTNAEGKILGLSIFGSDVITARKQQSGATYKFYKWVSGAAWSAYTTGLTLTSTGIVRIRSDVFNLDGTDHIAFTDGVNKLTLFDGTNWVAVDSTATGADFSHAGGANALADPKYITEFKNHIFVSGDSTNPNIVAHSAPNADYDWTAASGSGQLNVGFVVKQIKPFRDELFVFGETKIKKIVVSGTDFVVQDVANNTGLLASDSVVEINGDLLFLAPDGFRTIAATERIGDIELGVQSKNIQQDITKLITTSDLPSINAVVIRQKSQVRFFFSDENLDNYKNHGVLGGLVGGPNGVYWEWSLIKGIKTTCCTSGYIDSEEYILHGGYDGKVYRQEKGNSFDGENILCIYTTPYLDFGDPQIRKTLHKVAVFIRAEGKLQLSTALQFDWNHLNVTNPDNYLIEDDIQSVVYGTAVYGTSKFSTTASPLLMTNIEGSGFSNRITFSTNDTEESYSIQGIVYEYVVNGRK